MSVLPFDVAVAVVGAGTMGAGIAQVAAVAGHRVYLLDTNADVRDRAVDGIASRLARMAEKGRISADDAATAAGRVTAVGTVDELADAGLVIEAIVEDLGVKQQVLGSIEAVVGDDAIIATNTSSLSVTAIAAGLSRPGQVVGIHFFNPAPLMPLVEIVTGESTDPAVADTADATITSWGKTTVRCTSTPGFIVNRVARPYYGEALRLLGEGVAGAATIDAVATGAGGFRMGPFSLMDLVGLDVNLAVSKSVYAQTFNDARFAPNVIQQGLVDAGHYGQKSGRGFYTYGPDGADREVADAPTLCWASAPEITVVGDLGHASGLVDRLRTAGVPVVDREQGSEPGHLVVDEVVMVPSDGRTATELVADGVFDTSAVVVLDLAGDWSQATRAAVAQAAQADGSPAETVAGLLNLVDVATSIVADTPALVVLRTVAQLASVAADAVTAGVATPADIDTAMRLGTNYPAGPLEWADRVGPGRIVAALDHMYRFYGEERYRVASLLRRTAWVGDTLRGTGGDAAEGEQR